MASEYIAFISYSSKDSGWARWLARSIEGYKIPAQLVGTTNLVEKIVPERMGKVFRDRDDASASSSLAAEIGRALEASAHLIIIASPDAARSRYVEAEIREFHRLNAQREQPGQLLVLIVGGEPNVGGTSECLPAPLQTGSSNLTQAICEPLAADARAIGDGKVRALAKLVAAMLGVRFDSLVRRDLARRRRQRIIQAATAAAATVLTVGLGLRFDYERRERNRIERDRATLEAINAAERAKLDLAAGNIERARTLARQSLPEDGSVPFIPQAYDVLYRANLFGAASRNAELVNYVDRRRVRHLPIGNKRYLSWSHQGPLVIWGSEAGVTHRRNEASTDLAPVSAPDGSAIFTAGDLDSYRRFRSKANAWDQLDFGTIGYRFNGMSAWTALGSDAIAACGGTAKVIFGVSLPASGNGQAEPTWKVDLGEGERCMSLSRATDGSLLVGTWEGEVVQFTPARREPLVRYRSQNTESIMWVDVVGKHFAAGAIGHTSIFRLGQDTPILSFASSAHSAPLSPDGKHAVETNYGSTSSLIVHNLESGQRTAINCICTFQGFDSAGNVLTLDRGLVAELWSPLSGELAQTLHRFSVAVDGIDLLGTDELLLGLRKIESDLVIPLKEKPKNPILPRNDPYVSLVNAVFVGDDQVVTIVSHPNADSNLKRRFDAESWQLESADRATMLWRKEAIGGGPYGYGEVASLGHGLIAVSAKEDIAGPKAIFRIVTAIDGRELFQLRIHAEPERSMDGRYLVLEGDEGMIVYDLVRRTSVNVPAKTGAGFRQWALVADRLVLADGKHLSARRLDAVEQSTSLEVEVEAEIRYLCGDREAIYAFIENIAGLGLRRWSLTARQPTHAQVITEEEPFDDPLSSIDYRYIARTKTRCSAEGLALYGDKTALVWDIAANRVRAAPISELPPNGQPSKAPVARGPVSAQSLANASLIFDESSAEVRHKEVVLARIQTETTRLTAGTYLKQRGWVALGYENGRIDVWDLAALTSPTLSLEVHRDAVSRLVANQSGTAFLSADRSGAVWHWPALKLQVLLRGGEEPIQKLAN